MDQTEFVITIKGAPNTGKSGLAHIIENALRAHGVDRVVVAEDMRLAAYGNPTARAGRMLGFRRHQPTVLIRYEQCARTQMMKRSIIEDALDESPRSPWRQLLTLKRMEPEPSDDTFNLAHTD